MNIIILLFILLLLLILFWFYFHREPRIDVGSIEDNTIVSPAYGKIYKIIEEEDKIHVIIILNVFDIHTQYYPVNGTVINQIYDANGKFELVYKLYKSQMNEKVITTIQPNSDQIKGEIIVQQIAGMFVRRITTTLNRVPEPIVSGQKLGRIKFGSRVDVILPKQNLNLLVKEGEYVNGPTTLIGTYT